MYPDLDGVDLTNYKTKKHRKEIARIWFELENSQEFNNDQEKVVDDWQLPTT